jgi:hypothetical protein
MLDCGCVWTKMGRKVKFDEKKIELGKCINDHPLNAIDFCLINNYVSLKYVALMISEYSEGKRTQYDQDLLLVF